MASKAPYRLHVFVRFEPREVEIRFPESAEASAYFESIANNPKVVGGTPNGRSVILPLPSGVTGVEASTSQGGFIFNFASSKLREEWKDNLWEPYRSKSMFINRHWKASDEMKQRRAPREDPDVIGYAKRSN